MSKPRYVPRSYLALPKQFGRVLEAKWRPLPEDATIRDHGRINAAVFQHQVSFSVTQFFMPNSSYDTFVKLAEALATDYYRIQKVLNGHLVMQLEDFGALKHLTGLRIAMSPHSPADSFGASPQSQRVPDVIASALVFGAFSQTPEP